MRTMTIAGAAAPRTAQRRGLKTSCLLPFCLLYLAACTFFEAPGGIRSRYLRVESTDFAGSDARNGEPSTLGSALLKHAATIDDELAAFIAREGLPDAAGSGSDDLTVELVYLDDAKVFVWRRRVAGPSDFTQRALSEQEVSVLATQKECAAQSYAKMSRQELRGRVWLIGQRLMDSLPAEYSIKNRHAVDFAVIDSTSPIAVAANDNVAISTAVFDLACTDDEVAFIVGHEIAHIALRHRPRVAYQGDEQEADMLGIRIVQASGYAPKAAIKVLQRLEWQVPHSAFGVHPSYDKRVEAVSEFIDKINAETK